MKPNTLLEIGKGEEKSAREILNSLAKDFHLDGNDIKYILDKTPVPKQMQKNLLLQNLFASIALFIRCSKSKVPPMSFKLFLEIINSKGYKVTQKSLMMGVKRLKKGNIYPPYCKISVLDMLDTYAPFIEERLGFGEAFEEIITEAKKILEKADEKGISQRRSPVSKIAAALYIAAILSGEHRSQKEISNVIGISEGTVRETYQELADVLGINVLL